MYPPFLLISVSVVFVIFCTHQCTCLSSVHSILGRVVAASGQGKPQKPANSTAQHTQSEPITSQEDEDNEEGPEKVSLHDYFITYLPRCPSSYTLYLEKRSKPGYHKRTTSGGLGVSQYTLCRQRGRARLRECSPGNTGSSRCITKAEYMVTVVESSDGPLPSETIKNNSVTSTVQSPSSSNKEECRPKNCPSTQLMAINMKNPTDCSSFFICILGQHFLLSCPPGHRFSEDYGVCIEKKYSNCIPDSFCKAREM